MDNKDFEMLYNSKIDKHIEYLKDCWLNKKTITIEDAKYFIKEFTHREGIDPGVDIGLVFKEFDLNIKKEFKAGDKVKLNQHIPSAMNRAIGYRKYYEVVRTENIQINKTKTEQFLAIDGVKGLTSAEYFDLYVEDENRDFTLDELVFIQGHLGSISDEFENELSIESDNKRLDLLKRKIDTIKNINKKITKLFMRY